MGQELLVVTNRENGLLDKGINFESATYYITKLLDTLRFVCRKYEVDTQYKTVVEMAERNANKLDRRIFKKLFPYRQKQQH